MPALSVPSKPGVTCHVIAASWARVVGGALASRIAPSRHSNIPLELIILVFPITI
jgi:nitrate/nitrite transporter NarK